MLDLGDNVNGTPATSNTEPGVLSNQTLKIKPVQALLTNQYLHQNR